MPYKIITIDPRPASKDAMIQLLKDNAPVVGVEFTLPELIQSPDKSIQYINANIDDQHVENATGLAAIEIAAMMPLPSPNTTFAIVRADADALGAVAVLNLRARGELINLDRVMYIADRDKFNNGAWPGPKPIVVEENRETNFSTLGKMAFNFKMPVEERVRRFEQWLMTGTYDGMQEEKTHLLDDFRTAVEQTTVDVQQNGIALVESHHIGATAIGYHFAPILIIRNDAFRLSGGDPHIKFTVCQFTTGYIDMKAIISALNEKEQAGGTWGGSATIAGSPQGVSSTLGMDEVVAIVKSHLL